MRIKWWDLDNSEPNSCSACPEPVNGLYYAHIECKDVEFVAPFCGDCAYKMGMRKYFKAD